MSNTVVSLGERLKSRREELGLSQSQAARELDVARTAYRLWEMEAARPSPDRWRLIARWLGVSVATMLLAEDLIDDSEAHRAENIAGRLDVGDAWDAPIDASTDFFDQERASIDRRTLEGVVTQSEADRLANIVERLRSTVEAPRSHGWRRASLTKEVGVEPDAIAAARAAVMGVTSDIPSAQFDIVVQLTSELVADVVRSTAGTQLSSITLVIDVLPEVVRVRVMVPGTRSRPIRTVGEDAGWGWAFVAELASRWGAGNEGDVYAAWFEVDLPEPGESAPRVP